MYFQAPEIAFEDLSESEMQEELENAIEIEADSVIRYLAFWDEKGKTWKEHTVYVPFSETRFTPYDIAKKIKEKISSKVSNISVRKIKIVKSYIISGHNSVTLFFDWKD